MSWLDSISDSMDMNLSTLQEIVKVRGTWRAAAHRVTEADTTQRLNNTVGSRPHLGVIWPSPFPASTIYGSLLPWQVGLLPLPLPRQRCCLHAAPTPFSTLNTARPSPSSSQQG